MNDRRGEPRQKSRLRETLGDAWTLAWPFWRTRSERRAWWLLAAVITLTLGAVWLNVRFSVWNNNFYNTLQNHNLPEFWRQLGIFGLLAGAYIVAAVYRQYLQQLLFIRWRTWMTSELQRKWLQPGTAYRLASGAHAGVDNPDQRIAEDARGFVSATLDIGLGLLNSTVTLLSFIGILWQLSGTLIVPLGRGVAIPGYMVWVALAYSLAGTWVVHLLGHPLVGLHGQQQKVEADFRYALVQMRDNAEAIALAAGETREDARLTHAFDAIRANWLALIRMTKRLTWFSAGYGQVANVFPILAAAPRYFSGAMQLGGLMQTAQAFGQVQGALSWFIDAYPQLTDWRATVRRLTAFHAAADADRGSAQQGGIVRLPCADGCLQIGELSVHADGRDLVQVHARQIDAGERLLIAGPSGAGKSSLLRAVAGLWREGGGTILLPANVTMMFVPQRPYLPEGSLREALAYPREPREFSIRALVEALRAAGLGHYAPQLDEHRRWSAVLSPGEQQRVHFARVFLQRPQWVFLDESTSALDEAAETALYREFQRRCPASTVISVGHRSTLRALHDEVWTIATAVAANLSNRQLQARDGRPADDAPARHAA